MKLSKSMVAAAALSFYSILSYSQNPDATWEFGLRGALLNSIYNRGDYSRNQLGLEGGAYLTRYLNNRWSLRGELSYSSDAGFNGYARNFLSTGIYGRYRMHKFFSAEAGLEARQLLNYGAPVNVLSSKAWLGGVVHLGKMELNLRYSPGFQPNTPFSRGGWTHNLQAGFSVPLWRKKKKSEGVTSGFGY